MIQSCAGRILMAPNKASSARWGLLPAGYFCLISVQREEVDKRCQFLYVYVRKKQALLLLLGFNGPVTEAEPQTIIMTVNEIHIHSRMKGEEGEEKERKGTRAERGKNRGSEKLERVEKKGGDGIEW